jgi:hypothetical protein
MNGEPNPGTGVGEQDVRAYRRSVRFLTLRVLRDVCGFVLPPGRFGDRVYAWLHFVMAHGRLPSRRMLFNDVLYRLRVGKGLKSPLRVFVSDKEFVKTYVDDKLGPGHAVSTIAILRSEAEIDAFTFPDRCCIKPTHFSGRVVMRLAGEPVDTGLLRRWLRKSYYTRSREANYRRLAPKIIVEPILFDNPNLPDYKFFCYRGEPRMIQVDFDRATAHSRILFDTEWNPLSFGLGYPIAKRPAPRPANLHQMLDAAAKLSASFDFVRVDFYTNGAQFYIGEITNCHAAGGQRFVPPEAEETASRLLFTPPIRSAA